MDHRLRGERGDYSLARDRVKLFISIRTKRDATGLSRGVSRSLLHKGKAKRKVTPRACPVESHVIATDPQMNPYPGLVKLRSVSVTLHGTSPWHLANCS